MANKKRKLRRELGVFGITAITTGIIIGAGVFIVTGIAAKYAGALTWVAYLIGAIPVVLAGLSTIFLVFVFPVEGGESYVYPTRIVHKFWGFLSGWAMWFAMIGPVAITAKAFVSYLNALPGLTIQFPVIWGAIIVTIIFFIINWVGIKTTSIVQNILFSFMVVGLAIYIVFGLFHLNPTYIHMASPGFSGVMKAASLLIFSYGGLTLAADLGEEAKEPAVKTVTKGILIGALIPIILYVGSAFVSTAIIPWEEFAASSAPYAEVATKIVGPFGVAFVVLVAWAAILSSHNGEQAVGSRIFFGLSRDKLLGGKIMAINNYGVPGYGLILTDVIAIFLIATGTIEFIAEICVAMFLYNWIITHVAVIMTPKKYPELYNKMPESLRSKWFMIIPWVGIAVSLYLLYLQGWKALLFVAIWMGIATVVYYIGYSKNKEEFNKLVKEWPAGRYEE